MLQQQLVGKRLDTGGWFQHFRLLGNSRHGVDKGGWKRNLINSQQRFIFPEEPHLDVKRSEDIREGADGLGAPQKQDTARIQAVVKQRQELFLQFRGQIDQQVAADQDIQLGKGGIHDDVLGGEGHHLADLFADPVVVVLQDKKTLQPFRRDIHGDVGRIDPLAGLVDRIPVKVGGKDLQRDVLGLFGLFHRLLEDDRQRIGLLTGRTTGRPGPQCTAGRTPCYDLRDGLVTQLLP